MKKIIALLLVVSLLSCEEIVNEPNISNETITLLAPANDTTLEKGKTISFNWVYLGDSLNYHLQVATPTFAQASQIKLDTVVNVNQFSIDSLSANSYEWRVKGVNFAYETEYTINGFVVE
ncbi:hypothetical protein [Aureibaculum luteum]|uniref:hypothetical protein n=1 Tax=Aureibaculum luteum TaxID=1548456 RepID=UPI000E50C48E|nr:hypothetical protein [Aureibaculum luteum]